MLMLIEQHQLVKKDRTERQQLAAVQACDWHWTVPLKNPFEQAIERFDRLGTQLVKEPPYLHPAIGMRICPPAGRYQLAVMQSAFGAQRRGIVMLVTQDIAYRQRQFGQQPRGDHIIGLIGRGEFGSQRNPQPSKGYSQMQFPAVPPAMIARLAPGCFEIDAGMRHHTLLTFFACATRHRGHATVYYPAPRHGLARPRGSTPVPATVPSSQSVPAASAASAATAAPRSGGWGSGRGRLASPATAAPAARPDPESATRPTPCTSAE